MATLVFTYDKDEDDFLEGLVDFMNQPAINVNYGHHVTTVEFSMFNDELGAHRLGKQISKTFPEIQYYVKDV
jgi:hypothetical protein